MQRLQSGPIRNLWLGTSCEDQKRADERLPELLQIEAAAVHWCSAEPLLGPIDIATWLHDSDCWKQKDPPGPCTCHDPREVRLDWIVAGGESGPDARPMHPDWARSIRDQCAAAGVAFHFKQWGEWAPGECASFPATRTEWTATFFADHWKYGQITPAASAETHRDDEPDLYRISKARAGRLLDGIEHNGMPGGAL